MPGKHQLIFASGYPPDVHCFKCLGETLSFNFDSKFVSSEKETIGVANSSIAQILVIDFTSTGFTTASVVKFKSKNPLARVIAFTVALPRRAVMDAIRAGVTSYVRRDCDMDEIAECIEKTRFGDRFFCAKVLSEMERHSIFAPDGTLTESNCAGVQMSDRELEVITLIAEGMTNNDIADALCLSSHTVNTHRRNIMSKLGINNTASVVMFAVKNNLISPNKFLFGSN